MTAGTTLKSAEVTTMAKTVFAPNPRPSTFRAINNSTVFMIK
jgi:hypothetical protein